MDITKAQLIKILPLSVRVADAFVPALNAAMAKYEINTAQRIAAFISQIGHESGQLLNMSEGLSYSEDRIVQLASAAKPGTRWRSLLPRAKELARNSRAMGNAVYANRMGNGNEASNDGYNYRGRGILQITGKDNYRAASTATGVDFVAQPELLEQPIYACLAAAEFWHRNRLNAYADKGDINNIGSIINTGSPGKIALGNSERVMFYKTGLLALAA